MPIANIRQPAMTHDFMAHGETPIKGSLTTKTSKLELLDIYADYGKKYYYCLKL